MSEKKLDEKLIDEIPGICDDGKNGIKKLLRAMGYSLDGFSHPTPCNGQVWAHSDLCHGEDLQKI